MKRRRSLEERTRPSQQRTCDYCTSPEITWKRGTAVSTLWACKSHTAQAEKDWDKEVIRINYGI